MLPPYNAPADSAALTDARFPSESVAEPVFPETVFSEPGAPEGGAPSVRFLYGDRFLRELSTLLARLLPLIGPGFLLECYRLLIEDWDLLCQALHQAP